MRLPRPLYIVVCSTIVPLYIVVLQFFGIMCTLKSGTLGVSDRIAGGVPATQSRHSERSASVKFFLDNLN